jgi:hypothetical protein
MRPKQPPSWTDIPCYKNRNAVAARSEPVASTKVKPNSETVRKWADAAATNAELDKKVERERKAAYKKLHTPIAGNHARQTGSRN